MTALPVSPIEALKLVAKTKFRPFDNIDWYAFAGCESDDPFIGEIDDITVVIDGDTIMFNRFGEETETPDWTLFNLRFENEY